MSKKKCCVPTCSKSREEGAILHFFPNPEKDNDRFTLWKNIIGGEICSLDDQTIFEIRRICHCHFESKYYTRSKRLTCNAIPTLWLEGEQSPPSIDSKCTNSREIKIQILGNEIIVHAPSTSGDTLTTVPVRPESTLTVQPQRLQSQPISSNQQTEQDISAKPHTDELKRMSEELLMLRKNIAKLLKEKPEQDIFEKAHTDELKRMSQKLFMLRKNNAKLQKEKDSLILRLKKALKLSQNVSFQRAMDQMSPVGAMFTKLQFREIKKKRGGRRFTEKEKMMALDLYKQCATTYKWLSMHFVLPSTVTLKKIMSREDVLNAVHHLLNENRMIINKAVL